MAIVNLLKSSYTGRLGETVGAKWKDKNTLHVYTRPAYTNTPAQEIIRKNFGFMTKLFSPVVTALKPFSALDTRSYSLKNALIRLNKSLVQTTPFQWSNVSISRGGLPPPSSAAIGTLGSATLPITWTAPADQTLFSSRAQAIIVVMNWTTGAGVVDTAQVSDTTASVSIASTAGDFIMAWVYNFDYRGRTKVASLSSGALVGTPPTAERAKKGKAA